MFSALRHEGIAEPRKREYQPGLAESGVKAFLERHCCRTHWGERGEIDVDELFASVPGSAAQFSKVSLRLQFAIALQAGNSLSRIHEHA